MKTQLTKLALSATLGIAITFTLNACEEKEAAKDVQKEPSAAAVAEKPPENTGDKGGGEKLLETIAEKNEYWSRTTKFEYDKQNRIVKIDDKTITYANNSVTVGDKKFVIKGNTVTTDLDTLTIDKNGYILSLKRGDATGCGDEDKDGNVKMVTYLAEYQYENGNLIGTTNNGGDCEYYFGSFSGYQYDSNKSPFSNSNTPNWLLQYLLEPHYASKNNIVENSCGGDSRSELAHKYEYASDGFPTKRTSILGETNVDGDCAGVPGTTSYIYH